MLSEKGELSEQHIDPAVEAAVERFLESNPHNSASRQTVISLFNGEGDRKHLVADIFVGDREVELDNEYPQTGPQVPEIKDLLDSLGQLNFGDNRV